MFPGVSMDITWGNSQEMGKEIIWFNPLILDPVNNNLAFSSI